MPYKNKEDRNKAVRRYRAKKKEEERGETGDLVQKKLTEILTEGFNFKTIPFRDLVEIFQTDYVLTPDGVYSKKHEKIIDDMEIFFGLNMLVAVETPVMTSTKEG